MSNGLHHHQYMIMIPASSKKSDELLPLTAEEPRGRLVFDRYTHRDHITHHKFTSLMLQVCAHSLKKPKQPGHKTKTPRIPGRCTCQQSVRPSLCTACNNTNHELPSRQYNAASSTQYSFTDELNLQIIIMMHSLPYFKHNVCLTRIIGHLFWI